MTQRTVVLSALLTALLWGSSTWAEEIGGTAGIDAFLRRYAINGVLSATEKDKLGQTLALKERERRISNNQIANLLKNPFAWEPAGRKILRSVIDALPGVANVPGVERTIESACQRDEGSFRGFGFEMIAARALDSYTGPDGVRARLMSMSNSLRCSDGSVREEDGLAMLSGADQTQRLVSMKSISSKRALKRLDTKAVHQLALRNGSLDPAHKAKVKPAILVLGYSDPMILREAQQKDWQTFTNMTGGKLLVLAVNQLNPTQVTKVTSVTPNAPAPGFAGKHQFHQRQRRNNPLRAYKGR